MAKRKNLKDNAVSGEPVFAVLDPRGIEPEREIHPLSPRLNTLEGKTVNIINLHGGNEEAIESVVPDLKAAAPGCNIVYFRTDGGFGGVPLTDKDWAKMLDCDAAILGHNFWGGTANYQGRVAAQMERKGIPVVLETWDFEDIKGISKKAFRLEGVPEVREVFTPPDTALTSLKEFIPEFIDALTRPLTSKERKSGTYKPPKRPRIAMAGTYREVQEYFEGDLTRFPPGTAPVALMTDGLPVTPPIQELVAEMLKGTSHAPDEIVNPRMDPEELITTVEGVAINGVMAGCKPEYMPVLLAMAELGACVGCTWDCDFGHVFTVSGPIAKEIRMNSGFQMLSPGNPANSSIARACTLMGINLGGVVMGVTTIGRMGAHLWGLTFAESEDSPWEGLNIDEGYDADDSVLLSFGGYLKLLGACLNEVMHETNLFELQNGSPDHLVAALKASKESRSAIVLFTPDTAKIWKDHYGFNTVQQLQDYLYDNVTRSRAEWGSQYFFYMTSQTAKKNPRGSRMINPDHLDLPDDALVPIIVNGPKSIKIIVAGGRGTQWGYGGYLFGSSTLIDKWR